ncbi:MAG: FAD-dependent oxidoreductase [bacterium]
MITAGDVHSVPLFKALPERERETLADRAADVRLRTGDWLAHEGEPPFFHVVLEGQFAVFKLMGGHDQRVMTLNPGEFIGEVTLLLGSNALGSIQALEPSRAMRLTASDFHDLVSACPILNGEIMKSMASRVGALQQLSVATPLSNVTVTGPRLDPACHDVRDFLVRNHVAFRWVEPAVMPAEGSVDATLPGAPMSSGPWPVVNVAQEPELVTPTMRALAEKVGLQTQPSTHTYDVVIVGGGPAGLASAVYGASEGLRTLLVERVAPGGQAGTSSRIENYLGFPSGLSGDDLSLRARQQALRFGAELVVARDASSIVQQADGMYRVSFDDDGDVQSAAVILATGVAWRRLSLAGSDTFMNRGVYYGAALTEASSVRGKDVYLVGGGNSAGQAAMLFANFAERVTLLVRGPALAASMSRYLIDQLAGKSNIRIETECEVVAVDGNDCLESITVSHRGSGERTRRACAGLFIFIGAQPETEWLPGSVIRDQWDFVCTGRDVMDLMSQSHVTWPLERDPYLLETSAPGIFAAGDVRHGSIKRVASGVGEGSMAIAFVHQYLAERAATHAPV